MTEDDVEGALRCLALVFDEKGILQGHEIEAASTVGFESLLVIPGSPEGPAEGLSYDPFKNVTDCAHLLWDKEEIQRVQIAPQYKRPPTLAGNALAFAEIDGVPLVIAAHWNNTLHLWNAHSDCLMDLALMRYERLVTTATYQDQCRRINAWRVNRRALLLLPDPIVQTNVAESGYAA